MKTQKTMIGLLALTLAIGVWPGSASGGASVSASGGDAVYDIVVQGDIPYRVHVFTNTGSAMLTVSNGGFVDCLVVGGGGGGGGGAMSGGGGGGGVITMQNLSMTSGVYEVTIGAGGLGGYAYNLAGQTGVKGENSSFGENLIAFGGGGGCGWSGHPSTSGGSGGGGNSMMAASPGVAGQGHAGNIGNNTSSKRSGGGGGDYLEGGNREGQQQFAGSAATMRESNAAHWRQKAAARDRWPLPKSLCGIPHLYHLSLAYGRNLLTGEPSPAGQWRVRNVVAWCRPNPPVGALGDKWRPATSYLTIACVSGSRYFSTAEAILCRMAMISSRCG